MVIGYDSTSIAWDVIVAVDEQVSLFILFCAYYIMNMRGSQAANQVPVLFGSVVRNCDWEEGNDIET